MPLVSQAHQSLRNAGQKQEKRHSAQAALNNGGAHTAIFSRRWPRVSIIRAAASSPTMLTAANIRNTDPIPVAPTMKPTIAGPTADAKRSQDVASPVPIARMRVG